MSFVINSSTTKEESMNINTIVMDIVSLNMIAMIYQNSYGAIKIIDPESDVFYVMKFKPMPYILHN